MDEEDMERITLLEESLEQIRDILDFVVPVEDEEDVITLDPDECEDALEEEEEGE